MKELVSESGANLIVVSLSIILLILGIAAGLTRKRVIAGVIFGLGLAVLNLGLWWGYNIVIRSAGLDSAPALAVMVVIFAAVGAAVAIAVTKVVKT